MQYTARNNEAWDSIAYSAFKNEFLFPDILEENRQYNDVLIFEGGEVITIPENVVTNENILINPFQNNQLTIIRPPWAL